MPSPDLCDLIVAQLLYSGLLQVIVCGHFSRRRCLQLAAVVQRTTRLYLTPKLHLRQYNLNACAKGAL